MSKGKQLAFPLGEFTAQPQGISYTPLSYGLTKRELLAAMAMQGLLANDITHEVTSKDTVLFAIEHADALLAELAKGEDDGTEND